MSERMILTNYTTMQRIRELKGKPLTRDLVNHRCARLLQGNMTLTSSAAMRVFFHFSSALF